MGSIVTMGIFGNKDGIIEAALGASGVFDKDKKTDKAAAFGVDIGASIGSGQKWTFEDSMKLGTTIGALASMKEDFFGNYDNIQCGHSGSNSNNIYDDLILSAEREEQLEEAGIDTFDFEIMDDGEKREALEYAGLNPFDFDMF